MKFFFTFNGPTASTSIFHTIHIWSSKKIKKVYKTLFIYLDKKMFLENANIEIFKFYDNTHTKKINKAIKSCFWTEVSKQYM